MKMCDIGTESFAVPSEIKTLSQVVRETAADVLGYQVTDTRPVPTELPLRRAIAECGIEVLDPIAVVRYQAEMVAAKMITNGPQLQRASTWGSATPTWGRNELQSYRGIVPDFALERAIQIKKIFPSVEFWVEELSETRDPFLIAWVKESGYSWAGEAYYIACWEEARFEAQL